MFLQIKLTIPNCTCLKDPQETKLGVSIMQNSIELIDEIGFEAFTFKKLAQKINSTEASVYRYFENKHQLLMFLYAWYWGKIEYQIHVETLHIEDAEEKLFKAIKMLIEKKNANDIYAFVDELKLKRIIENEGIKSILNKKVDDVNKNGAFDNYKNLVAKISGWIQEIIPNYPYSKMLVTTIVEGAHIQHFFADHLPRLTDKQQDKDNVESFFMDFLQLLISKNKSYGQSN
jgi:AcrR family transcriptional regulator